MSNGRATNDAAAVETEPETIRIRGAGSTTCKISIVDIPRDRLVVITGPSGSGKSSLAFDTLYAEGQRQYIESLSVYARQFLHQMERPDVDSIEGLQPTISVDQRAGSQNPRSTVATVTEIYDYLRLLMARLGDAAIARAAGRRSGSRRRSRSSPSCWLCRPGRRRSSWRRWSAGGRGSTRRRFPRSAARASCGRGSMAKWSISSRPAPLAPRKNHTIEAVVDRVVIRAGIGKPPVRINRAGDPAWRWNAGGYFSFAGRKPGGGGAANDPGRSRDEGIAQATSGTDDRWPVAGAAVQHAARLPRLQNELRGTGAADASASTAPMAPARSAKGWAFASHSIAIWCCPTRPCRWRPERLRPGKRRPADWRPGIARNWSRWWPRPESIGRRRWPSGSRNISAQLWEGNGKTFLGLATLLEKQYVTATDPAKRERLETFRGNVACAACGGARLRPEARACRLAGKAIHEITALPVGRARSFSPGSNSRRPIAQSVSRWPTRSASGSSFSTKSASNI